MRARQQWFGMVIPPNMLFFYKYIILKKCIFLLLIETSMGGRSCVKLLTLDIQVWGKKMIFRLLLLINTVCFLYWWSTWTASWSACKPASQSSSWNGRSNKNILLEFFTPSSWPASGQLSFSKSWPVSSDLCWWSISRSEMEPVEKVQCRTGWQVQWTLYFPLVTVKIFHWWLANMTLHPKATAAVMEDNIIAHLP